MERSNMIPVAALLLVFAAAVQSFDPSLVVSNVTECPVAVTKWEGFTTSDLISAFAPIISSATPSPCTTQVQSLATCAFDGSLEVQTGCCSTACAQQLKLLQDQDCIPFILQAICNATADQEADVRRFVPILLGAADRCVGYAPPPQVQCDNGWVIPVQLPSSVIAAGNSTAAKNASGMSTVPQLPTFPGEAPANTTQPAAAQTPTPAAAAAPATSPAPTPARATSSAVCSAGAAPLLALLLIVAAVVLARG